MKVKLAELYPRIGFMSEEGGNDMKAERWILDPIDGTTNLVYGYNMSSVSLAHFDGERVVFGVIYNPFNQDLFVAERGRGAYLNGQLLPQAPDRDLKDCIIEFGAGSTKKQYTEQSFAIAKEIFSECLDLRRICSSALAVAYVAAGRLNGYFERSIKPWDYAAATMMLEECGALCCDWEGKPIQYDHPSSFLCATPKALPRLLEIIQSHA
jgi:myo-inositol-1(or 4)-monophosphatase